MSDLKNLMRQFTPEELKPIFEQPMADMFARFNELLANGEVTSEVAREMFCDCVCHDKESDVKTPDCQTKLF